LAGKPNADYGSPALLALLVEQTERRTSGLNFWVAFPARASTWLAGSAAAVLILILFPVTVSSSYAELCQRFLVPWRNSSADSPFVFHITPGDIFAAKGRPLALSVQVTPAKSTIAPPQSVNLVITDPDGQTHSHRMLTETPDSFSFRLGQLKNDFTYRIEAGSSFSETGKAASATYRVTAIEPVELAAGSPAITIAPPAYARETRETLTVHGLENLTALQHSRARFAFAFKAQAVSAVLMWVPAGKGKESEALPDIHPLKLTPDGKGATVELPLSQDGAYQLLLTAPHDIC